MPGHTHGALPPPSEDSEMPGHTHGALPPFLRGIPIDWSEGHFIWAREGCECVVKFCPQHCRELIGTASSDHESEDGSSTPGPSLRVDASDPYGLSSNNYNLSSPDYGLSSNDVEAAEGPEGSGRQDGDDDDHNGEVDNDADDDEAGSGHSDEGHDDRNDIQQSASNEPHNPSVLPGIEGIQQSGEGSPSLSASPEDKNAAQDDPEATISPDNRRHEAEGMGAPSNQDQRLELPEPQIPPNVQRPEQQQPPANMGIDAAYLEALGMNAAAIAALSPEFRERVLAWVEAHAEQLRAWRTLLRQAPPASATASAPAPAPPPRNLPVLIPAGSAQQTAVPVYQTNNHLAREIRHLAREARALSDSVSPRRPGGPGGHHLQQRSPSDILAKVLNTSPSPAKDSSQAVRAGGREGGSVVGSASATSRTPAAQPGPSSQQQPMMPPMGFFPASNPKPVARRLFSRPDPPPQLPHLRPTPAPGTASAHTAADKVGEVEESSKVGERSGMVTRSQGRRRGRAGAGGAGGAGGAVDEVGGSSKVGESSKVGQSNKVGEVGEVGEGSNGGEASEVGESSKVGERSGMVTRSQGRRRGRAGGEEEREERRDALDEGYQTKEGTHDDHQSEQEEEQDIQGEPSGSSNVDRQLGEESSEQDEDELAGEKTSTKSRSKRGRPRKSGSTTYTYGKRNKKRKV